MNLRIKFFILSILFFFISFLYGCKHRDDYNTAKQDNATNTYTSTSQQQNSNNENNKDTNVDNIDTNKAAADKAAADKAAADKAAADKAAADKAAADRLARGKSLWEKRVMADTSTEISKIFNSAPYSLDQLKEMQDYLIDYNIKSKKPSGVDEQLCNMLWIEAQRPWQRTIPNLNTSMFIDAVKSIALKGIVPENIKVPFYPYPDDKSTEFKYISHAVNADGYIFYFYTRWVSPPGLISGFSYELAYWDASKKNYILYYVTIRLL